MKLLHSLDF